MYFHVTRDNIILHYGKFEIRIVDGRIHFSGSEFCCEVSVIGSGLMFGGN